MENSLARGYSTEKLINPIIANSIPIYWGDSSIFKYINKARVIYIPDYATDEELLEHIIFLNENPDEYNKVLNEEVYLQTPEDVWEKYANEIRSALSGFS